MLSKRQTSTVLAAIVLCLFSVGEARSQAAPPADDDRWEISLGGGYYLPARAGFREYYRGGPEAEVTASFRFVPRLSARIDFFFTRLPENKVSGDLKFQMFSIVPSIKVTLPKAHQPYFGAGLGYYRGTVKYHGGYYPTGGGEKKVSKGGVGLKLYAGLKAKLGGRLFLGLEGRYCHTFLGDPYKGDFGNVGGFSGMGKLGISF
jgi:opacity protein-like surface antigen